jgi:hypothetical protein
MVKVDTISSSQKSSLRKVSKTGSSGQSSFASSIAGDAAAQELSQVSGLFPTQPLLVLQEVSEKQTAKNHGDKILNLLDQLRLDLLSDQMPNHRLQTLANYLNSKTLKVADPQLATVLEEIEQRANIELAKRGLI